jgi:hypothetical protein
MADTITGHAEVHAPDGTLRAKFTTIDGQHMTWMSRDGTRITASTDRELTIWDQRGKLLGKIGGFRGGIYSVKFVGDEVWTGGADGMVRRWTADGVQLAAMMSLGGAVHTLHKTATGVIAFSERGVRFWTGAPSLLAPAGTAKCAVQFTVMARERPVIGVECSDHKLELYDVDAKASSTIADDREDIKIMIDGQGRYIATFDWLGETRLFSTTGDPLGSVQLHETMAGGWVGDKLWVTEYLKGEPETNDFAGQLVEVDPTTKAVRTLPLELHQPAAALIDRGGGKGAVLVDGNGAIHALDAAAKELAHHDTGLDLGHEMAPLISLAPGGDFVALGASSGAIEIYSVPALERTKRIDAGAPLEAISLDRDGTTLLTTTNDHRAVLWSVATGEVISALGLGEAPIFEATFTSTADQLMVFAGERPYLMTLPRATGERAELAAQIACRVPLRPEGGRLVPTKPVCK